MANIEDLYSAIANATSDTADEIRRHTTLKLRAGQLANAAPGVSPEFSNAQLHAFLLAHPDVETVAITRDARPVGLINRHVFMEQYGRPFSRELYGKESCLSFADTAPLVIPTDTPIELIVRHAVEPHSRVMKDGFICTQDGRYVGLGSGMSLLQAMSDIEAEKTRQLLSSIDYASAIQQSNLRGSDDALRRSLPESQLTWLPRDVVGGDCYFFRSTKDGLFGAIIDCTGHGVPGAFMTLITLSYLENQISTGDEEPDPAAILTGLNQHIKKVLGQSSQNEKGPSNADKKSDDGLDAFMFVLTERGRALHYAGARLEMTVALQEEEDLRFFEGDRMGVGYSDTPDDFVFASHRVHLDAGYRAFITTDGIIDQIGGPKNIAHGRKRLYQLLAEKRALKPRDFGPLLLDKFAQWQGKQIRRDDVCFFSFAEV